MHQNVEGATSAVCRQFGKLHCRSLRSKNIKYFNFSNVGINQYGTFSEITMFIRIFILNVYSLLGDAYCQPVSSSFYHYVLYMISNFKFSFSQEQYKFCYYAMLTFVESFKTYDNIPKVQKEL
jgi:hypothetical protein